MNLVYAIGAVIAAVGGSGMIIAAVTLIFRSGKMVAGQERLETSFNQHRDESRQSTAEFRRDISQLRSEHGERIAVLKSRVDAIRDER